MTQEEFEHIAPSLRDVMLSVGRSFFDNESDADDVAQEGLLALWKYSSRMDADAVHTALAIRIAARKKIYEELKRNIKRHDI